MVHKRPFDEEESHEVSYKQLRQLENNVQIVSPSELSHEGTGHSNHTSDEGDKKLACNKPEDYENLSGSTEFPFYPHQEVAFRVHDSYPCSSSTTRNNGKDFFRTEAPCHVLLSPDHYSSERTPRNNLHAGEVYSFLFDYPHRKLVPIGPGFQADIPPICLGSVQCHLSDDEKRLCGNVVIPMPDLNAITCTEAIGAGRMDCLCEDVASVKCVERHILEAREKLKITLGLETFADLGFYDMGEIVAEKWDDEEDQMFHEIVFSNPASSGKNFWENLSAAFTCRKKEEIVSYYFNVFMLRRRAEQNRCISMDIDSDNDEWPETETFHAHDDDDDDDDAEVEVDESGDGKNMVLESPVNTDKKLTFCDREVGPLQSCNGKVYPNCSFDAATTHLPSVGLHCHEPSNAVNVKSDNIKQWNSHFSGHELFFDSNGREWDVGYLSRSRSEADLLPTCSMIEEVFGAGSSNYKARDG